MSSNLDKRIDLVLLNAPPRDESGPLASFAHPSSHEFDRIEESRPVAVGPAAVPHRRTPFRSAGSRQLRRRTGGTVGTDHDVPA
jgi:hypothetical protein